MVLLSGRICFWQAGLPHSSTPNCLWPVLAHGHQLGLCREARPSRLPFSASRSLPLIPAWPILTPRRKGAEMQKVLVFPAPWRLCDFALNSSQFVSKPSSLSLFARPQRLRDGQNRFWCVLRGLLAVRKDFPVKLTWFPLVRPDPTIVRRRSKVVRHASRSNLHGSQVVRKGSRRVRRLSRRVRHASRVVRRRSRIFRHGPRLVRHRSRSN